nr:reverse transcriptase domain-containing protein [Tanacetum cinerariifolium]
MSTRSTSSNLFSPLRDPKSLIRRRNLGEPSSLFDFEEVMSIPYNNQGSPPAGPPPPNNNGPPPVVRPNGPAPHSMEELCQPSINGRGKLIALILIQATNIGLLTQHIKQNGVSDDAIHLSLFLYSLTHHATAWYDRLPRNSIHTFDNMMRKFLSKYFPPSLVTKLRNEITRFRQDLNESLFEAWECYKLSIDRCPNHNMLLVTKIDTFYNGLTLRHQDTINAAVRGTFMQKTPKECYELIENMTAHHTIGTLQQLETRLLELSLLLLPRVQNLSGSGSLPSNTLANPRGNLKAITTRSGVAYDGPTIPPTPSLLKEVKRETETTKDNVQATSSESTTHVQHPVVQVPIHEPEVASKTKTSIPYPSRLSDQKLHEKANNQMLKVLQIFQRLHFDISFTDDLLHMPKFASTFNSLLRFPAQSVGSSSTKVLDSPCLLVLITGTSQSRQHGKSESDSYYLSD